MKDTRTALKPCPFCGGEAEILRMRAQNIFFAWCDECETRSDYFGTEEEAAAAWNRRDGGK